MTPTEATNRARPQPRGATTTRRKLDPLRVGTVLLLLAAGTLVVLVALEDRPREPTVGKATPVNNGDDTVERIGPNGTNANAEQLLEKIEEKKVTSKKAKLLKSEMKKKLAQAQTQSSASSSAAAAANGRALAVLSGDAHLRKIFAKKLGGSGGVSVVDDASRGFLLSLSASSGASRGGVFAKCSAAISELPQRKLVASLSSRADVAGDGYNLGDLERDAKDACAGSLADDVASWIRKRK